MDVLCWQQTRGIRPSRVQIFCGHENNERVSLEPELLSQIDLNSEVNSLVRAPADALLRLEPDFFRKMRLRLGAHSACCGVVLTLSDVLLGLLSTRHCFTKKTFTKIIQVKRPTLRNFVPLSITMSSVLSSFGKFVRCKSITVQSP